MKFKLMCGKQEGKEVATQGGREETGRRSMVGRQCEEKAWKDC